MRTTNYYDFGLLQVNPSNNKRTKYGFNGTALRAPKKGDKKKWRQFLIFCLSYYRLDLELMKPVMLKLNITNNDIEKEKYSSKNRVVRHNSESKRLNAKIYPSSTHALKELSIIPIIPSQISYLSKGTKSDKNKSNKLKKDFKNLTTEKKIKRRNEIINKMSEPSFYEEFLIKDLKKRGLL